MRRSERAMSDADAREFLRCGFSGRLATIGADGYPYCVPLLYVMMDGDVFVHQARARGHLRENVDGDSRACFEVDEQDGVFAYGRFECDTGLAYRSVILFGEIRVVTDEPVREAFCVELMRKYGPDGDVRPASFFPRLGDITIYRFAMQRMTGKQTALPPLSEQWPARDKTKSPNAVAPGASNGVTPAPLPDGSGSAR
jgi:nitroimidazol reductase NimA-like FMN-containing flavoprotein (pyridoxamine 5'-phosphate oxidase superfamily)